MPDGGSLLARFAENAFWLARYMERAENLARILDVTETFVRHDAGTQAWLPVVQLYADEEAFFAAHRAATAAAVVDFYVLDRNNPTSIAAATRAARENARSLRHLISTEMWAQINVFTNWLVTLDERDVAPANLSRLCARIKEGCQTHMGVSEGTLYRDQVWAFYHLDKYLERADQTTRLLDIQYHLLTPKAGAAEAAPDAARWNALLRSVSGYHAFRRVYPRGMQPANVAEFLLFDQSFPRAVAVAVRQALGTQSELRGRYRLPGGDAVVDRMVRLDLHLAAEPIAGVLARGLHDYLDEIQRELLALTRDLGRAYFGHAR